MRLFVVVNSRTTYNFQTLALRVSGTVGWSKQPGPLLLAANSITLLRFLMKGVLEKLSGLEFLHFVNDSHLGPVNAKDDIVGEWDWELCICRWVGCPMLPVISL